MSGVRHILQTYVLCTVLKGESIKDCHVPDFKPLVVRDLILLTARGCVITCHFTKEEFKIEKDAVSHS